MAKHKYTLEDYKTRATTIHRGKYDYSLWTSVPKYHDKIIIVCPTHGEFTQTLSNHLKGKGCGACGREITATKKRKPVDYYKNKASKIHNGKYDYSLWKPVANTSTDVVEILCPEHGVFVQTPASHIDKRAGCPKCAIADRVATSRVKYGVDYPNQRHIPTEVLDTINNRDWLIEQHVTNKKSVPQMATELGISDSMVTTYLNKHNIQIMRFASSAGEQEVVEFLQQLGVDVQTKNRSILHGQELDIFLPDHNIAIEYNGLYWHSEFVGKTPNYHLDKTRQCEAKGIRLIHIFEDEWVNQQEKCKATLRHLVGKSEQGVFGRKCTIRGITWNTAKEFLDRHHLLDAGQSGFLRVGAFAPNGELIGVMVFGQQNNEGVKGKIELRRFVTNKYNHPGLASKMFKWVIDNYGYDEVVAFVDRRWFTGLVKSHIGFTVVGETPPAIWWTNGTTRHHRRFETKRSLLRKYPDITPDMTKREMLATLGYCRIWDCGKLKLVWTKTNG